MGEIYTPGESSPQQRKAMTYVTQNTMAVKNTLHEKTQI
jgi:hypothetical protein